MTDPGTPGALDLEFVPCPLCGEDEGEPLAVGHDFEFSTSEESFLAVRCRACGLAYLDPAPAPAAWPRLYPQAYFDSPDRERDRTQEARSTIRRVLAYCRELPRSAAILELAYGNQLHAVALQQLAPTVSWHVATPHAVLADAAKRHDIPVVAATAPRLLASRRFDAVLLLHALEHCQDPVAELECARACLRPGGSIMVLSPNLDSAAGQRFRGRHWAGYDFPRHRVLFGPASLRALARRAGLTVDRLRSVRYSPAWTHSTALLLSDWSAPLAVRRRNGRGGALGSSLAAAAEVAAAWSDRGAWLEAVLRAPEAEAA